MPPGNRREALKGDLGGQHCIRINDQWRICFVRVGVQPRRIDEIAHGKRGIWAETALRLAKYFGTSAQFWLNLQTHYDLDLAEDRAAEQIAAIMPMHVASGLGSQVLVTG